MEAGAWGAGAFFVMVFHFAVGLPFVAQQPELRAVEVVPLVPLAQRFVERFNEFLVLEAVVAQDQAHMGVVFLLDLRVVVLSIRK
ncbi:MAG: hypothetical protein K1X78_26955 [Verrucomicrobiaceae bacterium]|nr:hypothetical protein [Verrucomicrobiaceae bacterium]